MFVSWLRFVRALWGMSRLPNLAGINDDPPPGGWPRLSIVVACRNEQQAVRQALSSMLAQDYPALEVVAVDDRSEDGTGAILEALAAAHPHLRVVHVDALPAGWLGKTHALQQGAARATGELLLFTDADVMFAPGALRRAVAWVVRDGLGHAVALPRFVAPGLAERGFVSLFMMFLLVNLRVDEINHSKSGYFGFGAFNLVRRDAYLAIEGHSRLRFEVLDDIKLGLLLRRSGARQGCGDLGGLVRVRWQRGFVASMRGLIKNFFAGCDYSWPKVLQAALLVLLATTFPAVCLVFAPSPAPRLLAAAALVLPMALHGVTARRTAGGLGHEGLLLPVAGLCLGMVALASALITTVRGAVVWRGTRYDLRELRARCVR
jgi:glycosyltransferase involved in cell wall biosynthesis